MGTVHGRGAFLYVFYRQEKLCGEVMSIYLKYMELMRNIEAREAV
jgi:hypothetical protein